MYDARIVMGMGAGAGLVALLLALPSMLPPAVASEEPARTLLSTAGEIFPPPFNPDSLVKWDFQVEPSVSTTPLRQSTVRKIGYGVTEFVQVVQTSTGTYSSDALQSPHVEYPGILKQRKRAHAGLAYWSGDRWVTGAALTAGSFVVLGGEAGSRR